VGAGVEHTIGPFTLDDGTPAGAQGTITLDWGATSILFTAQLSSGTGGQISGTQWIFSNLHPAGEFLSAAPILTSSPIFPSIASFGPDTFTMNIGSFTFATTKTIQIDLVTSPVPEPSTAVLLLAGLAALRLATRGQSAGE
jgi:hypothetical protein